jgi:hypothetical protein
MNLEQKDSLKQIILNDNNNNVIKEEEYISYVIDSKNKLTKENIKNYDEELMKYFNMKEDSTEEDIVNKPINSSNNNSVKSMNNSMKLMKCLVEKLLKNFSKDEFELCLKLSREYFKKSFERKSKKKIDDCINFICSKQIKYLDTINLNFEIIQNIGYILMISYKQLKKHKIFDANSFINNIKAISQDSISQDPLMDYHNNFSQNEKDPEDEIISLFWEKNAKNYKLPAILIFLINSLKKIETMNIYCDINKEILHEDIDLLIMIIFNIKYIFTNVTHVSVNMIHTKLQCYIFSKYYTLYKNNLNNVCGHLKKRFLKLDYIYDKKWDFQTEFLLSEHRKIKKNEYLEKNKEDNETINKSKTSFLTFIENVEKEKDHSKGLNLRKSLNNAKVIISDFLGKMKEGKIAKCNTINKHFIENLNKEKEEFSKNNPDVIYKSNDKISNLTNNNFQFILLLINSINNFINLSKFDLIINDTYYPEFTSFFENKVFDKENKSAYMPLLKDFSIIDIISDKLENLNVLNFEINSLDDILFKKVLETIYINKSSFLTFNISFFSSDITYLQQSLYRKFIPNQQSIFKRQKWSEDAELKFLDELLDNFCINLQILFHLIRYKKSQIMGFNFDIPDIIESKHKYMIAITKFIVNILLYVTNKMQIIQKCIILAPKIKFNDNFSPFINQVLGNIDINNKNKILKELSFQLQLYKIINIKNIISESLIALNIGDCDIYTFKELVKYLNSFKFSKNSQLSNLSISFLKSIRVLSKEIYNLLYKIFNIKIKQLVELNIYTDIKINSSKEYLYLLNIFKNNWISSCTLTFNEKSRNIYELKECIDAKDEIKYFVSNCLEDQLLSSKEKNLKKKIDNNQIINKSDDAYWYLIYLFKIRYSCVDNDNTRRKESLSKFLTNKILSYIHFSKKINIKHELKDNNLK